MFNCQLSFKDTKRIKSAIFTHIINISNFLIQSCRLEFKLDITFIQLEVVHLAFFCSKGMLSFLENFSLELNSVIKTFPFSFFLIFLPFLLLPSVLFHCLSVSIISNETSIILLVVVLLFVFLHPFRLFLRQCIYFFILEV